MHPLHLSLLVTALAAALPAQDPWKDFRTQLDQSLRTHNFFSKVKVTAIERPPFLFYVEQAADGSADHEAAVVNSYMPFLKELMEQWNKHYGKPLSLVASPKAPGYAIAILSSGGRYLDFRTAINDPSLANARAHYTPDLRLAVTYLDTFGGGGRKIDDIQPLLHEVVHALQHAHAKNDKMTAPVWFNEGLADYRSSCDTMASSLKDPPMQESHVKAMTFGYASRAGKPYVNSVAELVAPTSYAEVLELARKRVGQVRPELALARFYAQSEMFVRFLHEANGGARAPQFVQYTKLVLEGASGLPVFQQAFVCATPETLAALEQEWLKWLDAELRRRVPNLPNLAKHAGSDALTGPEPMPPAVAFDTKGLAWAPEDFEERLGAARRLCARGEFEVAQAALPDPTTVQDKALLDKLQRERERIAALLQLRQRVIDDIAKSKGTVAVGDVRGKFVRRSETGVVLMVGKDERTLPLNSFSPKILQTEGARLKAFEGREVWMRTWLRYLQGTKLAALKSDLAEKYSTIATIRLDMTVEFADTPGAAAEVLAELQSMPTSDDPKIARASLDRLLAIVTANRSSPLLQKRREAIDLLARALAERAFDPNDLAGLGLTGATEYKDGVVKVTYSDPVQSPTVDMAPVPDDQLQWKPRPRVPFGGTHGISANGKHYQVAGSAVLRWAAPMRGAFRLELMYRMPQGGNADLTVMLMVSDQSALFCFLNGAVSVVDIPNLGKTDVSPVGGGGTYFIDEVNKWTMEFDGKRTLVTKCNDKEAARVDTGERNSGELWFDVHSGSPLTLEKIELTCTPMVRDPGKMREQFVTRTIGKLWP